MPLPTALSRLIAPSPPTTPRPGRPQAAVPRAAVGPARALHPVRLLARQGLVGQQRPVVHVCPLGHRASRARLVPDGVHAPGRPVRVRLLVGVWHDCHGRRRKGPRGARQDGLPQGPGVGPGKGLHDARPRRHHHPRCVLLAPLLSGLCALPPNLVVPVGTPRAGIVLALALRLDYSLASRAAPSSAPLLPSGRFAKPYFLTALAGYVGGLATTIWVMHRFQAAQPALLYLVPACSASLPLCADPLMRREDRKLTVLHRASFTSRLYRPRRARQGRAAAPMEVDRRRGRRARGCPPGLAQPAPVRRPRRSCGRRAGGGRRGRGRAACHRGRARARVCRGDGGRGRGRRAEAEAGEKRGARVGHP